MYRHHKKLSYDLVIHNHHRFLERQWECKAKTDVLKEVSHQGALDPMAELPSIDKIISVLQKCRKKKNLDYAKRVHIYICDNGLESHRAVGNYIVPMLVECGSMHDAQQVFNRLVHRNVHSWTSIMLGYVECGKPQHALDLYQKMQEEMVPPSTYTLMAVLKACARLKDVDVGRCIHGEITHKGFERDTFVGSALVNMYTKCGYIAEAQNTFDNLSVQNVVSWNALAAGYAEYGPTQMVLTCLEQMQLQGISPNTFTYVCVLKFCGNTGAIDKGRKMHADVIKKGFEGDVYVGSALVDMYAKCASISEAREVFNKLPARNVITYTALIDGYAEHEPGPEALACFKWMQLEGIAPDAATFISILKVCGSIRAIDRGREIHRQIAQMGFDRDVFVGNTLVDMYAKCGSLAEAREVFDNLPIRNVVSCSALVAGYAEHGPGQEALKCFELMQLEGISPNSVTMVCVLKACGSIGAIGKGRTIHADITQKGFDRDVFVGSTLVNMYAKCGSLTEAQDVFNKLQARNIASWNALISGYVQHGSAQQAIECFEQMQQEGISPDAVTFVGVLKACGSIGATEKGRELHTDIAQRGFVLDIFVGNTLVDMYAKCGLLAEAQKVFDKLPVRNAVSCTALISGYAEHGHGQEALKCFEKMQLQEATPDLVIFVCALKACGIIGAIEKAREIHCDIARRGFERDLSIGNTLVGMYAKCGSLLDAQEVFDSLPVKDVVSWNAIINGYGLNHKGKMALQFLEDMQGQGVKPDDVTFACLLTACSRASLLLEGQEIFNLMREEYGISPTVEHYTSMIDLLAKSGHLYLAEKFLKSVLSPEVWTALLNACEMYGEAELGLRCFQQLVEVNPECAAPYVLMAKIYANAGRWDDACRIEKLRECVFVDVK